ncbi:MAG: pantoate--beta-alanine ligase [Bacteroidetes bacterium 4572_128]|nr:MAG: pantoate--beta-alanine ligase [Bacteroidetes bacterium 4572_128]
MKIIEKIKNLQFFVEKFKKENKIISFIPTMGSLHEGHLSLIKKAKKGENTIIIVSVFVNPTQFNNSEDLEKYPRNLNKDISLLENFLSKNDIIFAPSEKEMYPINDNRNFYFGDLENVMEGKHRKGHFNGVAKIVSKLFDFVKPDKAFFGKKDFQQIAIIKNLVKNYNYKVEIIPCEIVREKNGLAMSSRNILLSKEERKNANDIYKILKESTKKNIPISDLKHWVNNKINENSHFMLEYFEIRDDIFLKDVNSWKEDCKKIGFIAVKIGNVRLIDNIFY